MQQESSDFFDNHPILAKLPLVERISIHSEIAAGTAVVEMMGYVRGMHYACELAGHIIEHAPGLSDDTKRAFNAYQMTLVKSAENAVAEFKKGEESNLAS